MCWVCFMSFLFSHFAHLRCKGQVCLEDGISFFQRFEWQTWVTFSEYRASPFGEYLELKPKYFWYARSSHERTTDVCCFHAGWIPARRSMIPPIWISSIWHSPCSMFCWSRVRQTFKECCSLKHGFVILTHSVHCELLGPMNSMPNMGSMPAMPGWSLARFKIQFSFSTWNQTQRSAIGWKLNSKKIYIHINSLFSPSVCFLLAAPSFRDFVTRAVSEAWMFLIKL